MDANKGITSITYNHLNLPTKVTFATGNIEYIYDASGVKLEKVVTDGSSLTKTRYAGNFIYEETGGVEELKFFNHAEGYVEPDGSNGYNYIYQYKDHLGNIRLSYTDADGNGSINASTEIVEEIDEGDSPNTKTIKNRVRQNNYYPFGLKHKGYNNVVSSNGNSVANKKGFANEELEEELGKNTIAYQWRDYDPALGRFNKIDRFSEKYQSLTPYQFTANNPIFFREIAGDSINVSNLQRKKPEAMKALNSDLESITGLSLNISENGNLEYETTGKGKRAKVKRDANGKKVGSGKARRRLKRAIRNKKTVRVIDNKGPTHVPLKNRSKMYYIISQINTVMNSSSPDLNPQTMGPGLTFMHELDHTVVGKLISDDSSNPSMYPGPTARRVNQIRRQLGKDYGQRSAYDFTKIGGSRYMPFSNSSNTQLQNGVIPTIQYLKF